MRHAFAFIAVTLAACLLGIGSAWFVLQEDLRFQKLNIGQWEIWPHAGEPTADPYTKAYLSRAGSIWMGTIEGLALFASKDSDGEDLKSNCTYEVSGTIPRGRLWTLTSADQRLFGSAPSTTETSFGETRYITSHNVIWQEDKSIKIGVSSIAQPGNWLPVRTKGGLVLTLRIYDTPLTSSALDNTINTPVINRVSCP